jgi:phosphatidate cytidylyltransferase
MALNLQTFRTRALTAVVFVVVMLFGLLFNQWSFFILFTIVHFGAWAEYQKLVESFNPDYKNISPIHRYSLMIAGFCLMLFFSNNHLALGNINFTELGFYGGIVMMILVPLVMLLERKNMLLKNIVYSFIGLIYISLPLALMIDLRTSWSEDAASLSMTLPLLVIFSIWINDTMAYIVGSFIGKTPLTPISPKKTWEGTIGGIILTILVITLVAVFTKRIEPAVHAGIMSALAAITGTYGDLFESKLKRMAGVKDSGNIMPGHGGFLDRFDSLLFASVAVWFYAAFFLK